MTAQTQKTLKELHLQLEKISRYRHCYSLMSYDQETVCPPKAQKNESETLRFLAAQIFAVTKSKPYVEALKYLSDHLCELDLTDRKLVTDLYKNYSDEIKVTPELDAERNRIFTDAYVDWVKAKNADDFSLFASNLSDVIRISKKLVALRPQKLPVIYDNFIGDYEREMTTERLDRFFDRLKERIIPLLKKITAAEKKPRTDFLTRRVAVDKQARFSEYLLRLIGFDFEGGILGTTEHPFTSEIGVNDIRVTTHYYETAFFSNVYSVIHEGGHAIFGQSEPPEYHEHHVANSMTMAMHESVSRFYENRIGRSREFIDLIYPEFRRQFEEFSDVSAKELYHGVNAVSPSLIRTEADELTYSLHIIIRYEMEKAFLNGEIAVEELPERWNNLYEEYLGIRPTSDKNGILQDVHWSGGFGYFPTYALGNAYNAMYFERMSEDFDVLKAIQHGHIDDVNTWMKAHVFKKASLLNPDDWIRELTGRTLDPEPYLNYLETKYSEIYDL